ncbi:hypothetical protein EJB05_55997, partial [Eragrostis curvula]
MLHPNIQDIIQQLPSYNGESFNARAYIDWELKVENKFDDHDLSEEEKIYIASSNNNDLVEHPSKEVEEKGTMEMMKRQLERYLEAWRAGKKCK